MDFELNKENILKIAEIILASFIFFTLLFTTYILGATVALVLVIMLALGIKVSKFKATSHAWLYDHYSRSDDGREFGSPVINAIPGENLESEPVKNYEGKEAWLYFVKNDRNTRRYGRHKLKGTIDVVLLDPQIPSMEYSGKIANFHTNVEWRDISEFRSYARKIFKESGKADFSDILSELDENDFLKLSKYYHKKEQEKPRNVNVTNAQT